MKLIIWILAAIVILAVTAFAVTNREAVSIDFWPLPYSATLPLFAILLGAVIVGFIFGSIAAWWSGRSARRKSRDRKWEIDRLNRELDAVKHASGPAEPGASQIPNTAVAADAPQLSAGGSASH